MFLGKGLREMSRLLTVLVLVTAVVLAGACGGGGGGEGSENIQVAFIPQLTGIPYFTAMEKGGNEAAADLGVEFLYTGPTTTSAPEQVRIMDTLVRRGFDAVSVSVLDPASINPAIAKARDQGVVVLTSDSDSPDSERQAYVAQALDKDLGYTLIDRLAKQIGEEGKIGIVSGESTATNLNTWIKFMKERLETKYPDIELVDVRYTSGGSSEAALQQAQELMTKYPDIKGLVAVASTTVPGVAQAVESAGKTGEVAVIGYGSPNTVRPFIKSGVMKESVLWNPRDLGYLTVWAMVQFVKGNELKPENGVPGLDKKVKWFPKEKILLLGPPLIIDKNNVDDYDF
jgi:ABC-type sugar transport system substrate-binding protein